MDMKAGNYERENFRFRPGWFIYFRREGRSHHKNWASQPASANERPACRTAFLSYLDIKTKSNIESYET